jgi:hypothetical protein
MSREIPEVVRATAGLAATVLDEVRKLPETLPGLPVRVIGLAMQQAMNVQQTYAGLVARGDELFTGVRGEDEPGMATFDDDEAPAADAAPAATPAGFRESAFDRAEPAPPDALADTEQAERALEEIAIEELVDAGPAPDAAAVDAGGDADAIENALLESEGDTAAATATDEGGTPVATAAPPAAPPAAPATEPVDGYDGFSIAQLRGRLRGYAASTVEELVAYEEATLAREPYLRMLRNRLQRLTADEVAASPLAPRGT